MRSEQINEIAAALAKAQGTMKNATFDKQNPHYRNSYASLASVTDTIKGPLAANGLSCSQATDIRDGAFVLVTTLMHSSGQWMESIYPLPNVSKPQELGSALTYARRYSLSAIACIAADEDDDAEGARTNDQVATARKSPVKPQAVEAPVDPVTGECSPHAISEEDTMRWGALFVAAVNTAKSEDEARQWAFENAEALSQLEGVAPKVHQRVMERMNAKIATFNKEAA